MQQKLKRKYGLFTAICMVVGIVIGSGIFFKAQTILEKTGGDMPMGILAWLIGGAIMLVCLLTFSFMGQKYERVNGLVDYAEATVGRKYGYAMGWFSATVYFPGMTSALAWLTARYTLEFLVSVNPDIALKGNCLAGPEVLILTAFYLLLTFGVNVLSPKLAGKLQTSTTVIKMIPLALMAVGGVIYGLTSGNLAGNMAHPAVVAETAELSAHPLFMAVCATAFAYEGWIIATSINAEIHDSRRNLPKALTIGGVVIIAAYLFYYIGVSGGATNQELYASGTTVAFSRVFGNTLGNLLKLFVAVSCLGTTNGLMLGCTRCMYSLAVRGEGVAPKTFSKIHEKSNMPRNSAMFALAITVVWFVYFYLSNIVGAWTGAFVFDSTELPIITIYLMYLPMLVQWMRKERDVSVTRRFVLPILALCGSVFMVVACAFSHGIGCVWYLIVFAVVMAVGMCFSRQRA